MPLLLFGPVDANHNHLGQTWTGTNNPLKIRGSYGMPDLAPLVLSNSNGNGLRVLSARDNGVWVDSAGYDGVAVGSAQNGVRVASVIQNGVAVGRAGGDGLYVNSTGDDGIEIVSAGSDGVVVGSTGPTADGLHVLSAGDDGVEIRSAGGDGVAVDAAGGYGVGVGTAGVVGVYVGTAGQDGVRIRDAGDDGIQIGEAPAFPTYGLYVPSPGTVHSTLLPNTAHARGEWALYTVDKIEAGNVFLSAQTLVAKAGGEEPFTPGDVVTAIGLADPIPGSLNRLAQVGLATADQSNIVGVVDSRMELRPLPGKDGEQELRSVDGPVLPGDYVAITVLGAAQVKVQDGEAIQPGQRLTAGEGGTVRALQTRTVEGMVVTEGAPVIGVALEAPKDGMVWVLVNPQ